MVVKFPSLLLILLVGMSASCQKFSKDFNSVQKVCGVPRASNMHYVQVLGADGQRLGAEAIALKGDATLTPQGCVAIADGSEAREIFLRHQTRSEGYRLNTLDLNDEPQLVERQLLAYSYSPATVTCVDEQITRQGLHSIFLAPSGMNADAYEWQFAADLQTHLRAEGSQLNMDLASLPEGRHTLSGTIQERYAPEQRHYDLSCTLVIDRTPPEFATPLSRLVDQERLVQPGEALTFAFTERSEDVTVMVCSNPDAENCEFSLAKDGRWNAPESGRQSILVKAIDRAGNESQPLRLSLRVYDETKVAAIQGDMQKIQQLVDAQEGRQARLLLKTVDASIGGLGTDEEKKPFETPLRTLRTAVNLSPDEKVFARDGSAFLDWMTRDQQTVLIFQKDDQLIARDVSGQEVDRWTLADAASLTVKSCARGAERELFLGVDKKIYSLRKNLPLRELNFPFNLSDVVLAGNCLFGKVNLSAGNWKLLDFANGTDQDLAIENFWMVPKGQDVLLLTSAVVWNPEKKPAPGNEIQYHTQDRNLNNRQKHDGLTDYSEVVKIFADGQLLALKNGGLRAFAWQNDQLTPGDPSPSYQSLQQADAAAGDMPLAYHVQNGQWMLFHPRSPEFFSSLSLTGLTAREKMSVGNGLLIYDSTVNTLELKVFDVRGNPLSTFTRKEGYKFKKLIGHQLLLETADAWVLVDLFPGTLVGQTRNALNGMQWGPFRDAKGQPARFARARVESGSEYKMVEEFFYADRFYRYVRSAGGLRPSFQKLIEQPLLLWTEGLFNKQTKIAVLHQQKDSARKEILILEGSDERTLALPDNLDALRLDKASQRNELLIVDRSGQIWRKSLDQTGEEITDAKKNVWPTCNPTAPASTRKALVYVPQADHYIAIACNGVYEDGQKIALDEAWQGDLLGLDFIAEAKRLLIYTKTHVYILEAKEQGWALVRQVKADWGKDDLVAAHLQADGQMFAFASKSGRVALVSLDKEERRDFRLPPARPFTIDDLSLHNGQLTLLGPEGLISVP